MTFAYFTLLIFILLNLFCAAYAKKLAGFTPANNHDPRDFLAKATGKAARANAAQQNGYETFAAYAAAVIVAHATGDASQGVINFGHLCLSCRVWRSFGVMCKTNRGCVRPCGAWAF